MNPNSRILLAAVTLLGIVAVTSEAKDTTKPNILFIFADDWGWGDLSCHGHPYVKTPNIDRLAREGTDFHRFTVASGVCSPSRTAVMTGPLGEQPLQTRATAGLEEATEGMENNLSF